MALSNAELNELTDLLEKRGIFMRREALKKVDEYTNPNYELLYEAITHQEYNDVGELVAGYQGVALEGSSRSGKTWSGIDIIIWLCLYVETACTINIYRETYNEFKTTLYDDFKRRLDDFGLPNPFHRTQEVKSFMINGNRIFFLGDGKHGGGCDYAFFNEVMHISKSVFDQVQIRCRKFWWADYNPSVTEHWFFDNVLTRPDVAFLRTTYKQNRFISPQEKAAILSFEPWLPGSYIVSGSDIMVKVNGKFEPISKANQPPPHPTNITNGTADEFMWKVYGLGLRGAMKGVIFPHVEYIPSFPDIAYTYANDFGFTTDPNALVKYAEDEFNIWAELLSYHPIENDEDLSDYFTSVGVERELPIVCDSSDKYTGENKGTIEMVKGLRKRGWKASKISKTKGNMFWINSMKKKKIHIIKNHLYSFAKKEQENYRMKEIGGIAINQPIDGFNHFWDAVKYGHISHNSPSTEYKTSHETVKNANY